MVILLGSLGIDRALHVSRTMVVILAIRVFSELQAICHCSFVMWLLFLSNCVSSSIWFELPSKNFIWKFLSSSFGMGFSIMGGGLGVGSDVLAISVFDEICSYMSRWYEFR